jgi:hypothetical protein
VPGPSRSSLISARALGRLAAIELGDGLAARTAARCISELVAEMERLNGRLRGIERDLEALMAGHGDPLQQLCGAGFKTAAT